MLKKLYVKLLYAVNGIKISKRTLSLFSEGVLIRVLKDIIRFYEICPAVKSRIEEVNILPFYNNETTYALFEWNGMASGGDLRLNEVFFTLGLQTMIEDESERFNINKINGFDAVIFHELGHVLDQYIIVKNTDDPYFFNYQIKNKKSEEAKKILTNLIPLNKKYIKKNISWYACKNERECFAELIAEIMTFSTSREPAKKLKDYLIKEGYFKKF